MNTKVLVGRLGFAALAACVGVLSGCGGGGGGGIVSSIAGHVMQGPVKGAKVGYCHIEAEAPTCTPSSYIASTDVVGYFLFTPPSFRYIIVSNGGTDTTTNTPAMPMRTYAPPANATNNVLTPLTTIVALTPVAQQPTVIATIQSMYGSGSTIDISTTNITTTTTPAVSAFIHSVQSTVTVITNVFTAGGNAGTISTAAIADAQQAILANVATTVANLSQANVTALTNAGTITATLATTMQTAVTSALADPRVTAVMDLTNNGAATTNATINTIATAVNTAVTKVAGDVVTAATASSTGGSITGAVTGGEETVAADTTVADNYKAGGALETATTTVGTAVTVKPTVATYTLGISGTPATTGIVGVAYSTFTPTLTWTPQSGSPTSTTPDGELVAFTIADGANPTASSVTPADLVALGLTFNAATGSCRAVTISMTLPAVQWPFRSTLSR